MYFLILAPWRVLVLIQVGITSCQAMQEFKSLHLHITPDTAGRYVNSATCVAEFIHALSLTKEKYGMPEWTFRILGYKL